VFVVAGTPREDRTVYVPVSLSRLVRQYVADVRPRLLPDGVSPRDHSQPLLINERGRPYERTNLYRRVVRILTEAGFGDRASVQFLRHTYGYLAYKRTGGNLLFVQRQLGHAHPMVTAIYEQFVEQSYAELADVTARAAVQKPRRKRRTAKV
jgi:integrase/recombinase XerD